jgi:tetratricopeptide (TPR) repeat protein
MSQLFQKAKFAFMAAGILIPAFLNQTAQAQTAPQGAAAASAAPSTAAPGATTTPPTNPFTVDWLIGNAVSDADSPQYQDVKDAITRFRYNDVAGATDLLKRARQKNTKMPPVEVLLAKLWGAAGQPNNARIELEQAVMAYPDDPDAYLYFADLALAEHRVTDAEAELLKAKSLVDNIKENSKRKRNFDIRLNSLLAAVAESRNQWQEALPYLKAWLDIDANNALVHMRLARTLFELGKTKEAYDEYVAAQKIDPKSINPYIALAELYEQNKDRDHARESIGYAVQQNPKDLAVHLQAARWGLTTNQLNEAQKYADQALAIDPNSLEAIILRGVIARFTGNLDKAQTLLEKAVQQAPANIEASNQLALVLIESPNKANQDRAMQIAELNLKATAQGDRVNPEIAATLAWVMYKLGDTNKAEQILQQVLSVGSISPDTAFYVGTILQDRGKADEAIKVLSKALETTAPFAQRQATSELLQKLEKEQKENKDKDKDKGGSATPAPGAK